MAKSYTATQIESTIKEQLEQIRDELNLPSISATIQYLIQKDDERTN